MKALSVITQEQLVEMALSYKNSSLAQEQLENAKKAIERDRTWINETRQRLNQSFGSRSVAKTSNLLVITPVFLSEMIQKLKDSEVYKNKLARANASIAKSKKAIDDFLNK